MAEPLHLLSTIIGLASVVLGLATAIIKLREAKKP
jgi:hypothetical protein